MKNLFFIILMMLAWLSNTANAQNKTQIKHSKAVSKSSRADSEEKISREDKISARNRDERIRTQYNKRMLKIKHNKKHFGNSGSKKYFNTRKTKFSRSKVKRDSSASSGDSRRRRSGWY
ncbi:hypothetical protein MYP_799 [Sporocytophaga myxococcoides]|uniref:Uncharacterized protein n=1 Tax=Sporocytophaga myxococcoides TaxID=153721 RepID=A0A098LAU7_9BACT|nr:hypothetical protein [Sporocytophaga myxococcoides]GAL83572.1 hypothetical protein MYP_799 [Sporocytophaga myxococcoides]